MGIRVMKTRAKVLLKLSLICVVLLVGDVWAAEKPNIAVIWRDDTGRSNISKYTHGTWLHCTGIERYYSRYFT